ncbi:hypothetical protein E2C01_101010 [Portunus trituberculatus]|uniref:Uncharacterized protein n=1 Tax=Portunus trituberculatus TaxID=210409 RepID=A0A5B7KF15_PORTR|nr:hypothetical protein [Portunus trituberculatus]
MWRLAQIIWNTSQSTVYFKRRVIC